MPYQVAIINSLEELEACPLIRLENRLWGKGQPPLTTARMGYLPSKGIVLEMTAYESNPLCRYHQPQDPVYKDSAMECFLTLDKSPHQDSMYLNFEFNSSGAMLANFGEGRENRSKITEEDYALSEITAKVEENHWSVRLIISNVLLQRHFGVERLEKGDVFHFNLYKIAEDKSIEHYGSYFPVNSETPNFHRPQDFGTAMIGE